VIPDMSDVLTEWALPYTRKTITRSTIDFEEVIVVIKDIIKAVIQPANKQKLNSAQIDWSLDYLQVYTTTELSNGEYIVYNGEDYKIIEDGNYALYGYSEVIAEQTKQPAIESTE